MSIEEQVNEHDNGHEDNTTSQEYRRRGAIVNRREFKKRVNEKIHEGAEKFKEHPWRNGLLSTLAIGVLSSIPVIAQTGGHLYEVFKVTSRVKVLEDWQKTQLALTARRNEKVDNHLGALDQANISYRAEQLQYQNDTEQNVKDTKAQLTRDLDQRLLALERRMLAAIADLGESQQQKFRDFEVNEFRKARDEWRKDGDFFRSVARSVEFQQGSQQTRTARLNLRVDETEKYLLRIEALEEMLKQLVAEKTASEREEMN